MLLIKLFKFRMWVEGEKTEQETLKTVTSQRHNSVNSSLNGDVDS